MQAVLSLWYSKAWGEKSSLKKLSEIFLRAWSKTGGPQSRSLHTGRSEQLSLMHLQFLLFSQWRVIGKMHSSPLGENKEALIGSVLFLCSSTATAYLNVFENSAIFMTELGMQWVLGPASHRIHRATGAERVLFVTETWLWRDLGCLKMFVLCVFLSYKTELCEKAKVNVLKGMWWDPFHPDLNTPRGHGSPPQSAVTLLRRASLMVVKAESLGTHLDTSGYPLNLGRVFSPSFCLLAFSKLKFKWGVGIYLFFNVLPI